MITPLYVNHRTFEISRQTPAFRVGPSAIVAAQLLKWNQIWSMDDRRTPSRALAIIGYFLHWSLGSISMKR